MSDTSIDELLREAWQEAVKLNAAMLVVQRGTQIEAVPLAIAELNKGDQILRYVSPTHEEPI